MDASASQAAFQGAPVAHPAGLGLPAPRLPHRRLDRLVKRPEIESPIFLVYGECKDCGWGMFAGEGDLWPRCPNHAYADRSIDVRCGGEIWPRDLDPRLGASAVFSDERTAFRRYRQAREAALPSADEVRGILPVEADPLGAERRGRTLSP